MLADRETELTVLGATISEPRYIEQLGPDLFSDATAQKIFHAMHSMNATGAPVDHITVTQFLNAAGETETARIASGLFHSCQPGTFAYFVKGLREKAARRDSHADLAKLLQNNGNLPLAEFENRLRTIAENLAAATNSVATHSVAELLDKRRNGVGEPPAKPKPIYTLAGQTIATSGNLVGIQAQSKAGKTALLGGMFASAIAADGDFLGITSSNPDGAAIVAFDTEQSPYDAWMLIERALRRGSARAMPAWLRSYRLADVPHAQRRAALRFELERAENEHGGLHSVIIDGAADLLADPNNTAEAFGLVEEFHGLAIRYAAPILCIIHENPGTKEGKTRGHLGSQLDRKAETNIRLEKDADGITTVWVERGRHCHIPKHHGSRFLWDDEKQMHVTTDSVAKSKDDENREDAEELAKACFQDVVGGLKSGELLKRIQSEDNASMSTAKRRKKAMSHFEIIRQIAGKYHLA